MSRKQHATFPVSSSKLARRNSYLSRIIEDEGALRLIASTGFRKSLQREQGSIKAYLDGWKLFDDKTIAIENHTFRFTSVTGQLLGLDLLFASESILPHDINVLIGPNGIGKSQLLQQMVKHWLNRLEDEPADSGFTTPPSLNQMVVISYSPFELFPVDTADDIDRRDRDVYKYFGLRGRKKDLTDSGRGSDAITLSRDFPRTNAARSLLECLAGDQKFSAIREWSNRLSTLEKVLKITIDFDHVAVFVDPECNVSDFYTDELDDDDVSVMGVSIGKDGKEQTVRYVPVTPTLVNHLKLSGLRKHVLEPSGIEFLKNGKKVHLSSGQRLFSYIVINILGTIRRNTLILIDEPELFLHPTLEIAFIRMLKTILQKFGSKALIATHSLVVVRECPRSCVHVLERTKDGVVIKRPPFETFGGDIQRISSYVFGDKSVSKPYEDWVEAKLEEVGGAKELIALLGSEVNEELLIQINAMGAGEW
jgi:ABC-type Mn2+/Zn2+ transport system ATPase subunit